MDKIRHKKQGKKIKPENPENRYNEKEIKW